MHRSFFVVALLLTTGTTRASEKSDVMAAVNQFIDAFNKGDVKAVLAACSAQASIIDEFPPYSWQGPTACSDWVNDFDANSKKDKITDPLVTLGKTRHVDITEDRAYVVVTANYKFKQDGKPTAETGSTFTLALQSWRRDGASLDGLGRSTDLTQLGRRRLAFGSHRRPSCRSCLPKERALRDARNR
jgi:ketosteroid isomerase-like protein